MEFELYYVFAGSAEEGVWECVDRLQSVSPLPSYSSLCPKTHAVYGAGYLLSQKERRLGSPEKPLSALGALGYKNYWTLAIMRYLNTAPPKPRLEGEPHALEHLSRILCVYL